MREAVMQVMQVDRIKQHAGNAARENFFIETNPYPFDSDAHQV